MRLTLPLILGVAVISGCSSSNDSESDVSQPQDVVGDQVTGDAEEVADVPGEVTGGVEEVADVPGEVTGGGEEVTDVPEEVTDGTGEESEPADVSSDAQSSTRVDFDITVPAYVSNALQVQVQWRVKADPANPVVETAAWAGDELWTVSGDLPADTEHLLNVTFFDDNGGITLGTVDTEFKTGTNGSESITITADQFDTDSWDADGDGVSNIDESIAGSDPAVDEANTLEVRESIGNSSIEDTLAALSQLSGFYEAFIPEERPFSENIEQAETENCTSGAVGAPITRVVDIDATGTGSFSETYLCDDFGDRTTVEQIGSRISTDGSVLWSGTYDRLNSSAFVFDRMGFTTESETVGEQVQQQIGTVSREFQTGSTRDTQEISYSVTGENIDGTAQCEPISGTFTIDQQESYIAVFTITRQPGALYWRIGVESEGQIMDEYLVASLGRTFYCDFGT